MEKLQTKWQDVSGGVRKYTKNKNTNNILSLSERWAFVSRKFISDSFIQESKQSLLARYPDRSQFNFPSLPISDLFAAQAAAAVAPIRAPSKFSGPLVRKSIEGWVQWLPVEWSQFHGIIFEVRSSRGG